MSVWRAQGERREHDQCDRRNRKVGRCGHSRAARHLLRQGEVEPEGDKHRENRGPARLRGVRPVQAAD